MKLNRPLFVAAAVLIVLACLFEALSHPVLDAFGGWSLPGAGQATPGWSLRYLAILDLILSYTILGMGLGLVLPGTVQGRVQGVVTLVLSLVGLLACLWLAMLALAALALMLALLVAVPFGTLAYLALFGHFPEGQAQAAIGALLALKMGFLVCLALSHRGFLANKGLLALAGASIGGTLLAGLLVGLMPSFLVSIADVVLAIVVAVVGAVWLLLPVIGSLWAIVLALLSAPAAVGR